jgi:calcineurin-like phosphoesterase family protein
MTEWLISDTHFQHENIIKYCSRPYRNADEMDRDIFRRWLKRVKQDDIIYHLGDVGYLKGSQAILSDQNRVQRMIHELPGTKILIRGNHDKTPQVMRDVGFDVVCESMVVRVPNMNDTYVVLNHRPLTTLPQWGGDSSHKPTFNIHGHIHNSTEELRRLHEAKGELVRIPYFNINVSVELTNYEPVTLEHVVKNHIAKLKKEGRW